MLFCFILSQMSALKDVDLMNWATASENPDDLLIRFVCSDGILYLVRNQVLFQFKLLFDTQKLMKTSPLNNVKVPFSKSLMEMTSVVIEPLFNFFCSDELLDETDKEFFIKIIKSRKDIYKVLDFLAAEERTFTIVKDQLDNLRELTGYEAVPCKGSCGGSYPVSRLKKNGKCCKCHYTVVIDSSSDRDSNDCDSDRYRPLYSIDYPLALNSKPTCQAADHCKKCEKM